MSIGEGYSVGKVQLPSWLHSNGIEGWISHELLVVVPDLLYGFLSLVYSRGTREVELVDLMELSHGFVSRLHSAGSFSRARVYEIAESV
ncbi:hypothetical protein QYF36_008265 [Acer negundo]|nr:hypothetical protein QYF36_008265 [Acer negundo]